MALHVDRSGEGPRLALVHGFTQTGRSWAQVAPDLAVDHEVVVVDAPGHGGSADARVDLVAGADLLLEATGPATLIGYSMGARLCLHAGLAHPDEVAGLVLLGGTAGLDDPADRSARVARDRATAARIAEVGLQAFLAEWVAQPLFAGVPADRVDLADRARNTIRGLQSSLELAGTGAQEPLWGRLGELSMPVLVVAGEHDAKFSALAERLAAGIGAGAELALIPGAGHAAHLEQPEAFTAVVRRWLAARAL